LSSTLPSMALAHLLENWQNRTVAGCKNKHPDEIGWLVLDPSHASLNQFERAEVTPQEQLVAFWQDCPEKSHSPAAVSKAIYSCMHIRFDVLFCFLLLGCIYCN
jgi:hypothetical protein